MHAGGEQEHGLGKIKEGVKEVLGLKKRGSSSSGAVGTDRPPGV